MTDKKDRYAQKTEVSFRTFSQRADAPKTAETVIPIDIIDRQGRNYTLRNAEDLQLRIDESLIIDNGLHMDAQTGKLLGPESLARAWFEPIRRERQKREEQRLRDLFAESVPLIWRQRERILADPQLFVDEGFGTLSAGRGGPSMDRIRGALHARMPEMRRTDADLLLLGVTVERPQQPFGHLHRMRLSATSRRRGQFRTPRLADHAYCQPVSGSAGGRCLVGERSHGTSKQKKISKIIVSL